LPLHAEPAVQTASRGLWKSFARIMISYRIRIVTLLSESTGLMEFRLHNELRRTIGLSGSTTGTSVNLYTIRNVAGGAAQSDWSPVE